MSSLSWGGGGGGGVRAGGGGGASGTIHCLAQQQRPDHSLQWLPRLTGLMQVLAVDKGVHSLTAHSLTAVQLHMLKGTE
jgi:hypothetical protein